MVDGTSIGIGIGIGVVIGVLFGIVSGHEGTVKIESEIGKGTKVHIILPKKPSINQDTVKIYDNLDIRNKNNF